MKRDKIGYWLFAALFGLSMLSASAMYVFDYEHASAEFTQLGFPLFIIYPLALAKTLGVIGVLQQRSETLKEWAYAGFTFNILLAFGGHYMANDGEWFGPLVVLGFMIGLYVFDQKLKGAVDDEK
ncbi:DoxX family protein [bacterium SCSIO 12741]|nr:DoxX family protein [bacterium SCSIO 12741]